MIAELSFLADTIFAGLGVTKRHLISLSDTGLSLNHVKQAVVDIRITLPD